MKSTKPELGRHVAVQAGSPRLTVRSEGRIGVKSFLSPFLRYLGKHISSLKNALFANISQEILFCFDLSFFK